MKTTAFIVLKRTGPVRMTKGKPALARDEVAIGLSLEVPDSAFRSPIVHATITIPEHAVIVPEISVETIEPDASVDRSPEGQDPQGLGAEHESAVGATSAETPNPSLPNSSGGIQQ